VPAVHGKVVLQHAVAGGVTGEAVVGGGEADVAKSGNASREGEVVLGGEVIRDGPLDFCSNLSLNDFTGGQRASDRCVVFVFRFLFMVSELVLEHTVALGVASERVVSKTGTRVDLLPEVVFQHAVSLRVAGEAVVVEEERGDFNSNFSSFDSGFNRVLEEIGNAFTNFLEECYIDWTHV